MECKIVDTTLRDGEQKPGVVFGIKEKLQISKHLDELGIYQIEAGVPAMGGEEKESIFRIKELGLKSRISSWNRLNIKDIQHSIDCGVEIIHMSAPVSKIQMKEKLKKDEDWIELQLRSCINYARKSSAEITVGFEDASRADFNFLLRLCRVCLEEGVKRVRYADTVGILTPGKTYDVIKTLKCFVPVEIEMHAHNDFGMAVPNSIAALKAGAEFIDCTLKGIGERAGNCDYDKFMKFCRDKQ